MRLIAQALPEEEEMLMVDGISRAEQRSPQSSRRSAAQAFKVVVFLATVATVAALLSQTGASSSLRRRVGDLEILSEVVHIVKGSGSGSNGSTYHAMNHSNLEKLWKVERTLANEGLCPAATETVGELRRLQWPRRDSREVPHIKSVIYINLEWDKKRRDYMEEQLKDLKTSVYAQGGGQLMWTRLPAVAAEAVEYSKTYTWWRQKGFSESRSPDVRGDWATAACAISHFQAISMISQDPEDLVMITEDDVDISPNLWEIWESLWPYIPLDWDVLRVGWFSDHQNCTQVVNEKVERAGWMDPENGECAYCGAQAYIVNPTSKERVLQRFEMAKIAHADELLGAPTPQLEDPRKVPELNAYVVWPMLARTKMEGKSTLFKSDRVMGRAALD